LHFKKSSLRLFLAVVSGFGTINKNALPALITKLQGELLSVLPPKFREKFSALIQLKRFLKNPRKLISL
jgi:hypothetical protein